MTEDSQPAVDDGLRGVDLYAVELARSVVRDLAERPMPPPIREAFERLIGEHGQLARRPLAGKTMTGRLAGKRRWKLGNAASPWRVIYEVDEDQWSVQVVAVGYRADIYR